MKKLNLEALARVTGGTVVANKLHTTVVILSEEHEDWLNEAGFSDTQEWKREDKRDFVTMWPKHENIMVNFFTNNSGDLCWFVKVFGKENDLFGRVPAKIDPKLQAKTLPRIAKQVAMLDLQMLRVSNLYMNR